jgi:hypothetical protein
VNLKENKNETKHMKKIINVIIVVAVLVSGLLASKALTAAQIGVPISDSEASGITGGCSGVIYGGASCGPGGMGSGCPGSVYNISACTPDGENTVAPPNKNCMISATCTSVPTGSRPCIPVE